MTEQAELAMAAQGAVEIFRQVEVAVQTGVLLFPRRADLSPNPLTLIRRAIGRRSGTTNETVIDAGRRTWVIGVGRGHFGMGGVIIEGREAEVIVREANDRAEQETYYVRLFQAILPHLDIKSFRPGEWLQMTRDVFVPNGRTLLGDVISMEFDLSRQSGYGLTIRRERGTPTTFEVDAHGRT